MKKSILLILCGLCGGVLLSAAVFLVYNFRSKGEEIVLAYGDNFREVNANVYGQDGEDCISQEYEYTIVYYIDKSCGSCINSLYMIDQMCNLFQTGKVNNVLLWQDEIGKKALEKTTIPAEANFCLKKAYISTSTPTYYIVERTGKIIFVGNQIKDVLDKIESLGVLPDKNMAKHYYQAVANKKFSDQKPILVYFSMVGCKDCEAAEVVIHSDFVEEEYNLITFYRDRENVSNEMLTQVDYGGILSRIFEIKWYPSFLIIRDEEEIVHIGEMSVDEVFEKLQDEVRRN